MKITHLHTQGFFTPAKGIHDGIDTGGQTRFVHEVAAAQSQNENNDVTVIARLMDESISGSSESQKSYQEYSRKGNLPYAIKRVGFGNPKKFIRKEDMYPKAEKIAGEIIKQFPEEIMGTNVIVSHYADAGLVGEHLRNYISHEQHRDIPHLHMPHSIGSAKLDGLLDKLPQNIEKAEKEVQKIFSSEYNFAERIGVEKYIYHNASTLIQTSDAQIKMIQDVPYGALETPQTVIHPGYNKAVFFTGEKENGQRARELDKLGFPGIEEGDFVIAIAARFVKEKGFGSLINALPHVLEKKPNTKLLIIGGNYKESQDRDLLEELQEQVKTVLDDRSDIVFFHEGMEQEKLAAVMRNVDVFASLRVNEPFGMAPLEALASGAFGVVDKTSGIANTLPEDVITRVDSRDPVKLANAILSADKLDKKKVLDHVHSNYTWEAIGNKIIMTAEELIKQTSKEVGRKVPNSVPAFESLIATDFIEQMQGNLHYKRVPN